MSILKTHRVKTKKEFIRRGKMHITDEHISKLNQDIRESVQKKNDEQTKAIDSMGLLDKKFK